MPRRSEDSERPGLCSMVRASSSSKLSKLAGPLTKLVIGAAFSALTPGRDVDQHEGAHELGRVGGQRDATTCRRATCRRRRARRAPARRRRWPGRAPLLPAEMEPSGPPSEWPWPGQVDGEQRAAQRQRDGVPGVGVLRAAVHQHQLGRAVRCPRAGWTPCGRARPRRRRAARRAARRRGGRTRRRSRGTARTRRRASAPARPRVSHTHAGHPGGLRMRRCPSAASPPWSWPPARAPGCARSGPSRCTSCAAAR